MEVSGVGGVLMLLTGSYGLVFGKILGGVGAISRLTRFEVGVGSNIWHGVWCGDQTLKVPFSRVSIACFMDASVANHLQLSNDSL
jgi:hypothetical protein